jgi:hypothetical protein
MIQAVVARLASNSFVLKGWSVTLTSVLLGFAGRQEDAQLARLTLLPALIFWALDSYYLAQERQYRTLFVLARNGGSDAFAFDVPGLSFTGWLKAATHLTTLGLHGLIVVLAAYLSFAWR